MSSMIGITVISVDFCYCTSDLKTIILKQSHYFLLFTKKEKEQCFI